MEPGNFPVREALIEAQGIHKSYFIGLQEVPVLHDVSLSIGRGEFVALRGKSGVGKSTLLHVLGALDGFSQGEVFLEGIRYIDLTLEALAEIRNRKIGFVFQFHHLLPEFTALENVMMPALIGRKSQDEAQQKATRLLEEAELGHRLHHRPGELSGGEQQRVALMRALMNDPVLVLADEPTGNLDETTSAHIHAFMRHLNRERGLTILIATHSEALAAECDREIHLVGGMITG